jgi:hypothetical protein
MQDLIELQAELDRERERCWDSMRQAKIDNDPTGYVAAKYRKDGIMIGLALLNQRIMRSFEAA